MITHHRLVDVASGALFHVAAIADEHVVRLGHTLELFPVTGAAAVSKLFIWQPWRVYSSENRFDGRRF